MPAHHQIEATLLPDRPNLDFEHALWQAGFVYLAGIDEAGRGPLAGPVTAAALVLPNDPNLATILSGVRDSKQMTSRERIVWAEQIRNCAISWAVGMASSTEVDESGIVQATHLAAERALVGLSVMPDHLLLDCLLLPDCPVFQTSLIKGDRRSISIAGASILAKTSRDAMMMELDEYYPGYGFANHKGYGTVQHLNALQKLGPSAIHRKTFKPVLESSQR